MTRDYNYDAFASEHYGPENYDRHAPRVGVCASDFEATLLDRLADDVGALWEGAPWTHLASRRKGRLG